MNEREDIAILYVDDEEINLFLFEATFSAKYEVITAISGKLGLEKLDENHEKIIVVISDMNMPEMNCVEFVGQAAQKFKNIAFFILTGYNYNEEIDEAIKSNLVQKYFSKPFNQKEIEDAIQEVLANSGN
ncbi:MAG: response regulator [Cyclobacteriaceae bacterium]